MRVYKKPHVLEWPFKKLPFSWEAISSCQLICVNIKIDLWKIIVYTAGGCFMWLLSFQLTDDYTAIKKWGLAGLGLAKFVASAVCWATFCCGQWIPPPPNLNTHEGLIRYMSLGKLVVPVTEQYTLYTGKPGLCSFQQRWACYPVLPDCIHVGYLMAFFPTMWFFDLLRGNTFPVPLYGPK
jgi:hypothetical protein